MLAKGGTLLTAVAVALLIASGVGAAFGVELPSRPTIGAAPAVQSEPPVETEPAVPAEPLPDPTPTTTAPAAPTPHVQAPPGASGGTAVSFTIVAAR